MRIASVQGVAWRAMPPLFHFVPAPMVGTILYPLNELKKREPELWRREVAKYAGREHVLEALIPPLGCLWNDVLHLSVVHPGKVLAALEAVGLEPLRRRFFQIDAATLDPERTAIFLNRRTDMSARNDESQWLTFDPESLTALTELTDSTRRYYRESAARGERPLLFGCLPHVFFRGALETETLPVLEA
jgi:hypothetical protein